MKHYERTGSCTDMRYVLARLLSKSKQGCANILTIIPLEIYLGPSLLVTVGDNLPFPITRVQRGRELRHRCTHRDKNKKGGGSIGVGVYQCPHALLPVYGS